MTTHDLKNKLASAIFIAMLALSGPALADTVELSYTDDTGVEQTLVIDENASEADLALAATLILNGNVTVTTTSDGAGDLAAITASISTAAADIAGGDDANVAAAAAAVDTAVPDATGETNSDVAPAETVVVANPSEDAPAPEDAAADEGTTDEGTTDEGTDDEGTADEGTDEGTTDDGTTDTPPPVVDDTPPPVVVEPPAAPPTNPPVASGDQVQ